MGHCRGVSRGRKAGVIVKSPTPPLVDAKLDEGIASLGATVLWLVTCVATCCMTPTSPCTVLQSNSENPTEILGLDSFVVVQDIAIPLLILNHQYPVHQEHENTILVTEDVNSLLLLLVRVRRSTQHISPL